MSTSRPVYDTPASRNLVKQILAERGIHPHDYQLDGIVLSLDGESLLVTMVTGVWKTGFFAFTMLVMVAIARDPGLALRNGMFPKNPVMVIILPTKVLQDDMKNSLTKLGLDAVVINGDAEKDAMQENQNIWAKCQEQQTMILIFPEELLNPRFQMIFCKTIGFGFRVAAYLWRKGIAKGIQDLCSKLRLFNSLNAQDYNKQTLGFLNDNKWASITIATDVLSAGWDSPYTKNVIVFGEPDTLDEILQKFGRAGRNKVNIKSPCAMLYHTKTAASTAQKVLKAEPAVQAKGIAMDKSVAQFILAPCKNACIDNIYSNLTIDVPCQCLQCKESLTLKESSEFQSLPGCGKCSGCVPKAPGDPKIEVVKSVRTKSSKP
ncbi:hypothetical protein NMY22_g17295 [Coprinellus aureogranulatus]|nr:hypothetical protein NMY22_g17295 [Coprinellus aureogranulatus]